MILENKNMNRSMRDSRPLSQSQKDSEALNNTMKTIQDQQKMKRQYKRWVPQSINNENAIFSSVVPAHKVLLK